MSNILWTFSSPLSDSAAIAALESNYGIVIPAELKKIIQSHNGAHPTPDRCTIPKWGTTNVKMLLSYNRDDPETIYDVIDYFMTRTHKRLIPFATDSGSGYFCMKDSLVVYTADEELFPITVAESFASFLTKLF